jgi:fatty acid desaturase
VAAVRAVGSETLRDPAGLFRHSAADGWLVLASVIQAALLVGSLAYLPAFGLTGSLLAAATFGASLCWCSNTVAHNHLHNPLFRSRRLNRGFSLYLSVLCGIPQSVWRARHLWHHAGEPDRSRRVLAAGPALEIASIAALWLVLLLEARGAFLGSYLPGFVLGLALCRLQGDMEHVLEEPAPGGVSYYGALYNRFWFNDGYHAEHHRWPTEHWTRLPLRRGAVPAKVSDASPHWRWMAAARAALLCWLERLPLRLPSIERFVLDRHERALKVVIAGLAFEPRRIVIVGGGLFPRSLILLRRAFPRASICVIDKSDASVARARAYLAARELACDDVEFHVDAFDPIRHAGFDLVITPLAYVGSAAGLERLGERTPLLRHDWIWRRRRGASAVVSWLLLKRMNLSHGSRR